MPPPSLWTLYNLRGNPTLGDHLNGLHLRKISGGFVLKAQDVTQPFATAAASGPPFTFHDVLVGDVIFKLIHVKTLPPNGANGSGTWHVDGQDVAQDPGEGDFTAQAGAGAAGDDTEAASSATA